MDCSEETLDRFGGEIARRRNRDDWSSPVARDHAEREAERIVADACAHYGVDEEELRRTKRGDLAKPSVAWQIWKETTVSQPLAGGTPRPEVAGERQSRDASFRVARASFVAPRGAEMEENGETCRLTPFMLRKRKKPRRKRRK